MSKMRAWVSLRAGAMPAAMIRLRSSRSVLFSTTGCFFFTAYERAHHALRVIRSAVTLY